MSSERQPAGGTVRHPDHDDVAKRLGSWPTFAGETPTADQLQRAAGRILDGEDELPSERVAMQTLRFVWRRLDLPHRARWKAAEADCEQVLEATR
jgi:hypothetical protein